MSEEKAYRTISFDGKIENWRVWKLKFLAKGSDVGYEDVLEGIAAVPKATDVLDETTVVGQASALNRKMNKKAYTALAMACEGVSFGCVEKACTVDLPKGDAALAWKYLCAKYEPATKMSLVSLKKEFAQCKLESVKYDPDEWINKLEHIRARIRGINTAQAIDDEGMMAHLLANLPKAYSEFITTIEYELEQTNSTVTLDQMVVRLRNFYSRKFNEGVFAKADTDEVALVAQFKGMCRTCGTYGHKSIDCKKATKTKTSNSGGSKTADVTCGYCSKKGHSEEVCWSKKKAEKAEQKKNSGESADIALPIGDELAMSAIVKDKNFFLCDSGATSHMTNDDRGLFDTSPIDRDVQVGNGEIVKATKIGSIKANVKDAKGINTIVTLNNVSYVPDLKYNLISVGKMAEAGASITYSNSGAHISIGDKTIALQSIGNNAVFGLQVNRMMEASTALDVGKTIDVSKAHSLFGHASEDTTRKTAALYGLKVTGTMDLCDACATAKAKQKNVNKVGSSTTRPGERLYVDISSVSATSIGGSKFMIMIVDDYSNMKWSKFIKAKSDLCDNVLPFIKELTSNGITVSSIRMDNAGENKQFGNSVKELGIKVEYTAPNTPQQNGVVERAIATIVSRGRAMMIHAGLPIELKENLWAECFSTSTKLSNTLAKSDKNASPYELFYGKEKELRWLRNLKSFGLIGYAANRANIKSKLSDRASKVMFIGYSDDHEGDCFRLYKLETRSVILSRDVRWSEKLYGQYMNQSTMDDEEELSDTQGVQNEVHQMVPTPNQVAVQPQTNGRVLRSGRVIGTQADKDLYAVHGSKGAAAIQRQYAVREEEAKEAVEAFETTVDPLEEAVEQVDLALVSCVNSTLGEPKSYTEAMLRADKEEWIKAVKQEYKNIKEKHVWKVIKRSEIQGRCSVLKTRWVFKVKNDGRYRARLVVKGYNQIPGVDYTESHSPVANDVTIRLLLILAFTYFWICETIDVETAFLYGVLKEDVYIEIPEGFNEYSGMIATADEIAKLLQALYGLVQACRVWSNTFIAFLISIGFKRSMADPCLLWRSDVNGFVVLLVYVDDCMVCGSKEGVKSCIKDIKKRFNISEMGKMNEFVGAKYFRTNNGYSVSQLEMVNGFETIFDIAGEKPSTPAVPGLILLKSTVDSIRLSDEQQTMYRSGVGKLLYLTKLSRPDMSCAVRELATHMDGADMEHWKALHRALAYAANTKYSGLHLEPKKEFEHRIYAFSDSNYASNKDTRRSVTGYAIYYNGALVSWKSKSQDTVTMSSTEAEYIAAATCAMEMVFVKQIIESIQFEVKLPMVLYVDNTSAIALARNFSTSGRTKHIEVRHHFIRELNEKGDLKMEFVSTDDNTSDIMTKGNTLNKYDTHSVGLGVKENINDRNREDVED